MHVDCDLAKFHHMDPLTLVETLADLFPHKPRSELLSRVTSCDRIELVIDDLIQEQNESQGTPELMKLRNVFPTESEGRLKRALGENDNNVEKAIEALMSKDVTMDEFRAVTGLLEDIIETYLQKHSCPMQALADLVCNYRKKKKVTRSKVQDSRNLGARSLTRVLQYTYQEDSREAKELRQQVQDDPPLQQINYAFLVKCLIFFEGKVDSVVRIAYLFVDQDASSLTYDEKLGLSAVFTEEQKAADILRKAKDKPQKQWVFSPKPASSNFKEYQPPARVSSVPPTKLVPEKVDLHGLRIGEAVDRARRDVNDWWAQEVSARQSHGILSKFGHTAVFIEPLSVIVGRGLHSAGGPKLRKPVMKMLDDNKFLYREDIGRFVVTGKRF